MKKMKMVLEYDLRCTPVSIFRAISTASGLREWFADNVQVQDDKYTFIWNKVSQVAHLLHLKDNSFIRYRWEGDINYYFEFRIIQQEMSGDMSLIITDFVLEDEYNDTVELWNQQVRKLKSSIGCAKK